MQQLLTSGTIVEEQITVSFVIPARNEERYLATCLSSIRKQVFPACVGAFECIVVDNQSTDLTAEIARQSGAQIVDVHPGRASLARNAGAASARGEWLAFVDADCELPPHWLQTCSRHFQDVSVLAVGATMRPPGALATWVEGAWYQIAHAQGPRKATPVRWLPSFNLLVRRRAFEEVGGFDERLVTCEDCDLGYRLSDHGQLVLDPHPATAHHGESRTLWQLFRREAWRSQGNLSVAVARPGDWRNWISLLMPAASIVGLVGAIVLAILAMRHGRVYWLGSAASLAVFLLPFGAISLRVARCTPATRLPSILVVFGTYLVARTAGLFFTAPRVSRTSNE